MKSIKSICLLLVTIIIIYGSGRLYFALTGGFMLSNISSDFSYDPRWEMSALSSSERKSIDQALSQEYTYLGKGCQSYVFQSRDGNFVIKFIKFQRFRPQKWINLFSFIPAVKSFQQLKSKEKKERLDKLFRSWKLSYECLKNETAVMLVHINKSIESQPFTIIDKLGLKHSFDLGNKVFLLQYRAEMLCPKIDQLMVQGCFRETEVLIDKLLEMLLSEYLRGFADNDHALMQNTGILDGHPIHIDAGQFIYNRYVSCTEVFKREIYDKTYNFLKWMDKKYPEPSLYLKSKLVALLGVDYFFMSPYVHKGGVNKIPHQLKDGFEASMPPFHPS